MVRFFPDQGIALMVVFKERGQMSIHAPCPSNQSGGGMLIVREFDSDFDEMLRDSSSQWRQISRCRACCHAVQQEMHGQ